MGNISYFLGCSSPEGFHSFFGELCPTHSGGYTYIIKGGPGTGKSSPVSYTHLGCHAYFGVYGSQDGDGTPTIDNARQINLTADAVAKWVG